MQRIVFLKKQRKMRIFKKGIVMFTKLDINKKV